MYVHKVLFNFKSGVTSNQINQMYDSVYNLKDKITEIRQIKIRYDLTMDETNYSGGFQIIFDNPEGLGKYLPHSEHKLVSDKILAICDDINVKDYYPSN